MKSPFNKPFGSRSPFGPQSGGGGGSTAPVLSNFDDHFDEDPPYGTFDVTFAPGDTVDEGIITWDAHSSITPPAIGGGDVATGTEPVSDGFTSFEPDLTAAAGELIYLHIRVTATYDSQVSNILTSQQFTVPSSIPANAIQDRAAGYILDRAAAYIETRV